MSKRAVLVETESAVKKLKSSQGSGRVLAWFRRDLRMRDNSALEAATGSGLPVSRVSRGVEERQYVA